MQETWIQSLVLEGALEKEMATHSANLAWEIPWTEEPGGLQPMGSRRVRHNWACTHEHTHTHIHTRARARQVDEVWPQDVDWVQVWSILSHLPGNKGLPGGSGGKVSTCNAGDPGSIPGSGRSPGEGNGNPLQYSFLENPMDRGVWWAIVMGSQDLDMT